MLWPGGKIINDRPPFLSEVLYYLVLDLAEEVWETLLYSMNLDVESGSQEAPELLSELKSTVFQCSIYYIPLPSAVQLCGPYSILQVLIGQVYDHQLGSPRNHLLVSSVSLWHEQGRPYVYVCACTCVCMYVCV